MAEGEGIGSSGVGMTLAQVKFGLFACGWDVVQVLVFPCLVELVSRMGVLPCIHLGG